MKRFISLVVLCTCMFDAGAQVSAAMKRNPHVNSESELYTRFLYEPVEGLGYERGINRRDPSSIIHYNDKYYVWYTRNTSTTSKWLDADIWYATSVDGNKWTEIGPAVKRGPEGSWDDWSVFTCNIFVTSNKYYLTYQAETKIHNPEKKQGCGINVIAMAWAETPDGPWYKLDQPILKTAPDGKFDLPNPKQLWQKRVIERGSWDSAAVHDPEIIPRWGKYWLYYKGHGIDDLLYSDSRWGVAVSDHPEGPYVKSKFNPVTNSGHEVWVWPWRNGIAAMVDWAGPESHTIQYTEDGINFDVVCVLEDIPPAGGAFIADKFEDPANGKGFSWGLCHYGRSDWNFLIRFDCDLQQGKAKRRDWKYFPHYSTVRDVMQNPARFNIPHEALYRRPLKEDVSND